MNFKGKEVCVVIPASGKGERMGISTRKQFVRLLGKPLICYTVEAFLHIKWIKKIILVTPEVPVDFLYYERNLLDKIEIIDGADSRHKSILLGLQYIQHYKLKCDVVIIHDGVRPLVSESTLKKVVKSAIDHGASGLMRPLTSTVIQVKENMLQSTLNRNEFKASETPQAFWFSLILDAYSKCSVDDMEYGTECLDIMQKYMQVNAELIEGPEGSWKVTQKKDLYAAEGILKENQPVIIVSESKHSDLLYYLKSELHKRFTMVLGPSKSHVSNMPNTVKVYEKNITEVLQFEEKDCEENYKFQASIIGIIKLVPDSSSGDFRLIQQRARDVSEKFMRKNIYTCYVIANLDATTDLLEKTAALVSFLVFEQNTALCGQVFYSI